jgi:hypothetical protein
VIFADGTAIDPDGVLLGIRYEIEGKALIIDAAARDSDSSKIEGLVRANSGLMA